MGRVMAELRAVAGRAVRDGRSAGSFQRRDVSQPNYDFLPEAQMAYSPAYDSFSPNPELSGRLDAAAAAGRHDPAAICRCTISPRCKTRCGPAEELHNPFPRHDTSRRDRGSVVFASFARSVTVRSARETARSRKEDFRRRPRCWRTGPSR